VGSGGDGVGSEDGMDGESDRELLILISLCAAVLLGSFGRFAPSATESVCLCSCLMLWEIALIILLAA